MSITEANLLALGQALATGGGEVEWRASASRSYYAAYHRANDWHEKLSSHGLSRPNQGVHATLIDCLTRPTVTAPIKTKSMSIGYVLQSMKAIRQKADYDLGVSVDVAEANTMLANAQNILTRAI